MTKIPLLPVLLGVTLGLPSCATETPTTAVIHNAYPVPADPKTQRTVVQVWYATTFFEDVVLPGADSDPQRTIPSHEVAYALVAVGWDPSSGASPDPTTLRPMQSLRSVDVGRGATLDIMVSSDTFSGDCEGGTALSQADADFITQRVFPGPFAGFTYVAATCTVVPAPPEADAGAP